MDVHCCITPSTPFEAAFDLLFVRGRFEQYFPSCWEFCEAMGAPADDIWVQAICTCRLMQLLPHPMLGVLLLCDEICSLEESKVTWLLARECCVSVVDVEVLVRVMRIFCQREEVLFDGAWRTAALYEFRPRRQWLQFGKDAAADLAFTRMWWNQDAAPFLEARDGMRGAIFALAAEEQKSLQAKLFSMERASALDKIRRAKQNKDVCADAKKKPGDVVRLTKKGVNDAKEKAESEWRAHKAVLNRVRSALVMSSAVAFDDRLAEIVVNISVDYPCLFWQMKAIVHTRFAMDPTWEIERRLHGRTWFTMVEDSFEVLAKWAKQ